MTSRTTPILVHLVGAAAASALLAFWALRLLTPPPPVLPVAVQAVAARDPDPRLAARLMGDVNAGAVVSVLNVQLSGVYAAGADSSAILSIDGKPPRAVLLGQEVVPGTRLVEVRPDGITLEHDGARSQYAVPLVTVAKSSVVMPTFRREGRVLTAPSQEAIVGAKFPTQRPFAGMPGSLQPQRPGDEPPAPGGFVPPGAPNNLVPGGPREH